MDNIKNRISISFASNLFRGGSTLLIGVLLARFLGGEDYGKLTFLMATSMSIKQLIDFGMSSAFFTFLSQETKTVKFVMQFWGMFFLKYIACVLLISFLSNEIFDAIWLGDSRDIVLLSLVAVAFQSDFWPIASQLLESQRKTVKAQFIFVSAQLIHFLIIFGLDHLNLLSVTNYLTSLGILWSMAGLGAIFSYSPMEDKKIEMKSKKIMLEDYLHYCLPLTPIIFLSFIGDFSDRWMLQKWGGSKEQSYFTISMQIASISLLFTASFIKIFWKEIAEAMYQKNHQRAITFYVGARKAIFYFGALVASASISWASEILLFLYGSDYSLALISLILLMMYSVHQSLGQIDSAFLMASGKTYIGLNVHALFAPIGIFISYFLISNSHFFTFGLGAVGLAMKMVFTQLISVNVIAYLIQREFKIRLSNLYQIKAIVALLTLAIAMKIAFLELFLPSSYLFILGLISYLIGALVLALKFPQIFGLPSDWLRKIKIFYSSDLSI